MTLILIRCDASISIGSGHVMRCRTLARVLQKRGATIVFLCRRQTGDLINLLEKEFDVLNLPEHALTNCDELEERDLYSAWLGCSQDQDADDCLKSLSESGISSASWLVVDHYGLDINWEVKMLASIAGDDSPRLLVIDDLADRQHHTDLLLDQNFFGNITETRYSGLVPEHCRQLLGPHYALLGPEYAHLHLKVPMRQQVKRVLVFFGGVDQINLTSRALEALSSPVFADLAVDVVIGLQSPHRQQVEELAASRPHTTLHFQLPSLACLIACADLAIGAGGATTWERACLGLPSIVIAIADNQLPFSLALHRAGQLQLLGIAQSVSMEKIRQAIVGSIREPWPKSSGYDLIDGWGGIRISSAMLGPLIPLSLRPAMSSDEALLFRWANDPQVRSNSCSPAMIPLAEHRIWFQSCLADPNRLLLIACDAQGCPVGQIRFDRQSALHAEGINQALISLSLDRCVRAQGLATEIVRLALQSAQRLWGPTIEAVAEIFATNIASQTTFAKAGFVMEDNTPTATSPSDYLTCWRWNTPQ